MKLYFIFCILIFHQASTIYCAATNSHKPARITINVNHFDADARRQRTEQFQQRNAQYGLNTKITDASPRPIRPISSGKPITATFKPIQTTRDTQDQETKRCETSSIGLPKTAVLAEERTDATPEFHTPTNIQASSSCSSRASTPSTSSPNSTFSTEVFYETQEITDRPFPYTELSNVASTASRASRTPSPGSTPPIDRSEQTSSRSPILMPAFCHPTQTKRKDELTEQIRSMIYLLGQLSKDDRAFSNIDTKDLLEIKSHLASPLQLLLAQIKK